MNLAEGRMDDRKLEYRALPEGSGSGSFFMTTKMGLGHALAVMMIVAAAFSCGGTAQAATSQTVQVSASIDTELQLGMNIIEVQNNNISSWSVPTMNYGALVWDSPGGPLRSNNYFIVVLYPNTSSRPYRITQTASSLTNGSATLPSGSCVLASWETTVDGEPLPAGSSVDTTPKSFVQNSLQIYASDPNGRSTAVPVTYAITSDPNFGSTAAIPADQPHGAYSTQITFHLELLS